MVWPSIILVMVFAKLEYSEAGVIEDEADVEVIDDPLAKNPEQRQARWRFYQRNGFVRTDHNLYYGKETFQVLSWGFETTKEQVADLALQKDNLFEDPTLSTVWESCEE